MSTFIVFATGRESFTLKSGVKTPLVPVVYDGRIVPIAGERFTLPTRLRFGGQRFSQSGRVGKTRIRLRPLDPLGFIESWAVEHPAGFPAWLKAQEGKFASNPELLKRFRAVQLPWAEQPQAVKTECVGRLLKAILPSRGGRSVDKSTGRPGSVQTKGWGHIDPVTFTGEGAVVYPGIPEWDLASLTLLLSLGEVREESGESGMWAAEAAPVTPVGPQEELTEDALLSLLKEQEEHFRRVRGAATEPAPVPQKEPAPVTPDGTPAQEEPVGNPDDAQVLDV